LIQQVSWMEQGVLSSRPLGVWLFLGNQGVGKTTLIEQFNLAYFNQEETIEWDVSSAASLKTCFLKLKRNPYAILSILNIQEAKTSVLQALKQAIEKAKSFGFDLHGAVMASDAFFPFPDCVEIADKEGVTAVIQPGGSIKDGLSFDYCNQHGVSMVVTGVRHFKH
ncbi:MAG: hypothetical protein RR220_08105, partial [Bacteroidaceae bacterium]